jgi:hypothetical protein
MNDNNGTAPVAPAQTPTKRMAMVSVNGRPQIDPLWLYWSGKAAYAELQPVGTEQEIAAWVDADAAWDAFIEQESTHDAFLAGTGRL